MIRSQGERKLGEWWPQAGEGCVRGGGKGSHRKGGRGASARRLHRHSHTSVRFTGESYLFFSAKHFHFQSAHVKTEPSKNSLHKRNIRAFARGDKTVPLTRRPTRGQGEKEKSKGTVC